MIRITLFFEATTRYGWSESYFITGDELTDSAMARARALARSRRNIMHVDYYLVAFRISVDGTFGDSRLEVLPANSQRGLIETVTQGEQPFDGLLVRYEAGAARRALRIMRGIPRGTGTDTGAYSPQPYFVQAWDQWLSFFAQGAGGNFQLVSYRQSGALVPVTALVTAHNGTGVTFTPAADPAPPPFAAESFVRFSRIVSMGGVNGNWKILSAAGATRTTYPHKRRILGTYGGEGFARVVSVTSAPIDRAVPLRLVRRDTGRPSDSPRGRRRRVI